MSAYDVSQCLLGKIPATGQTQCWNASGTSIACAGTGEDGNLQAGSPLAYQDNGDGTITDLNTGLMWEKKSDDGSVHDRDTLFTWQNAFTQIATLNAMSFAGHNDWRLPNARELLSGVDYGVTGPAVLASAFHTSCFGGCNGITCSCTAFGGHWSSTTVSSLPASATTSASSTAASPFSRSRAPAPSAPCGVVRSKSPRATARGEGEGAA